MLAKIAVLLVLSMWSGSACAFGFAFGAGGGGTGFGGGVANPFKYYPVCPRSPVGDSCQCRVAGASEANMLCRPGEYCDTRSGTCGPAPARR